GSALPGKLGHVPATTATERRIVSRCSCLSRTAKHRRYDTWGRATASEQPAFPSTAKGGGLRRARFRQPPAPTHKPRRSSVALRHCRDRAAPHLRYPTWRPSIVNPSRDRTRQPSCLAPQQGKKRLCASFVIVCLA